MNIKFTKMHGLGNDFIFINNMNRKIILSPKQVMALCDRHKGIGADGVIFVESSKKADCFMNYYNSDGSVAEMCGNGVRCVAQFLKDEILSQNIAKASFKIDTRAGIKEVISEADGTFSVNMGKAVFSHPDFPKKNLKIEGLDFGFVSMGNPHAITFVKDLKKYDLPTLGPKIENNKIFPNKINVELVEQKTENEYKVKVWERGCGITLACGTGACAVYAIVRKRKNVDSKIIIELPGGKLFMSENKNGDIVMRGPVVRVFNGELKN